MNDKYCPLRFREYGSNPIDQECIGASCAWFGKCSESYGEPIYGMPYGNMEPRQVIESNSSQEPREADENACSQDSREKLEADLDSLTKKWHEYDGNYMRIYSTVAYAQVKELLDRQMALTSREWSGYLDEANDQLYELTEECDLWNKRYAQAHDHALELQAQVDELESLDDGLLDKYLERGEKIADLQAQLDKLSSDELHWHSEADFWKRQYELICRAVEDVARNYCVDEGLA